MMQFDRSWWLPDGETHLLAWMTTKHQVVEGRLTYQYHKYLPARDRCHQRRVAVDVGAHVGLFSYWMARDFETLYAFEPKPEHAACWRKNMVGRSNATLYDVALGAETCDVGLTTEPSSSGDTGIRWEGSGVSMRTLDSYDLFEVDFLKIDCEGFEAFVLEGALETLQRCHPVVLVEQKPGHGQRYGRGELDAIALLQQLGARQVWDYAGDYVLSWEGH